MEDLFEDILMNNFFLVMVNLFTFPEVIHALRQASVGIIGTVKFRGENLPVFLSQYKLHKVGNDITRKKKRPRVTFLIDDYNHCVGGVNVSDYQILYYHPSKLVCYRKWSYSTSQYHPK